MQWLGMQTDISGFVISKILRVRLLAHANNLAHALTLLRKSLQLTVNSNQEAKVKKLQRQHLSYIEKLS